MNHYFLKRDKTFECVEIVKSTRATRTIKDSTGKLQTVHPDGVAWGKMYPRIFQSAQPPTKLFTFKGRAIVSNYLLTDRDVAAVPTASDYRFQPFICDVIDCIHSNENVLLTGGTGVGKTTHILQLAARIGQPVLRINFNGETRMSDLIGKMSVVNGETRWIDGVLPTAMRRGYWILLDELDFADPAVLSLLHPVLEADPMLTLKENGGEIIKPHPLFRIFATANSIGAMSDRAGAYGGTNVMNEAFLDRWHVVLVDNLPPKEEVVVLRSAVRGISLNLAKKLVAFATQARTNSLEGGAIYTGDNFSTRKLLAWAKKAALHRSAIVGARKSWLDKIALSDQDALMRVLTTHFGSGKRVRGEKPAPVGKKETKASKARAIIASMPGAPRADVLAQLMAQTGVGKAQAQTMFNIYK